MSEKDTPAELRLQKGSFSDLPGWNADNIAEAAPAFQKSCERIMRQSPDRAFGALEQAETYARWQIICSHFLGLDDPDLMTLRRFFEAHFDPYAVFADTEQTGLFTGYYEASLRGSREPDPVHKYPLHARPDDLVMVQLGEFREDLKGRRIAGRVINGSLKPYETRAEIVAGNWPHEDQVLVWIDDPVDAFFVQIQGSGRVDLADGSVMRIGYAGQNGHPYYAIGRELIERGYLEKEEVSMQSIRSWLEQNPDEGWDVMNTNASYVFFRELDTEGPVGGEGLALTPQRSLAIDRSFLAYGLPMWVDIAPPVSGEAPIKRLMIAQDTGGAIRGPVRGDVFWGAGTRAEHMAGKMKSEGRYWVLLPKDDAHSASL